MFSIKSIIDSQTEIYRESFLEFGDTPKGVRWNNKETQDLRFENLLANILPQTDSFSLLDVGCGTCALHEYLLERSVLHDYAGVDVVAEMLEVAREKYPGLKVSTENILSEEFSDKYDFCVLSGTLNYSNLSSQEEWIEYSYNIIEKMFQLANCGISFNLLTSYSTFKDSTLCYFSPPDVFDFCLKNLSRFVVLSHAMPLYEYTVTVFRPSYVQARYEQSIYGKYFPDLEE